jgi:SAM-dependent methyltransferase
LSAAGSTGDVRLDGMTIAVPQGFNHGQWIDRWDRMQRGYLVRREERFAVMVELVRAVVPTPGAVLDLGCGSGSVTLRLADAFPQASIVGIDFDPAMLVLARARLAGLGGRVQLLCRDLRRDDWTDGLPESIDAAVSATAMHWFNPQQLAGLYKQMAGVMRRGGIFLNADHVASDESAIQKAWEQRRRQMRAEQADPGADDWTGFWAGYADALGIDIRKLQKRIWTPSDWVEPGMPLAWHFDRLREAGFTSVDCFWRCDCDAIYGGIRA